MPAKTNNIKKNALQTFPNSSGSGSGSGADSLEVTPPVYLKLQLVGQLTGGFFFLTIFNKQVVLECNWADGAELETDQLAIDLKSTASVAEILNKPLTFLLRAITGKPCKDQDIIQNADNKIGACVDLFPLALGDPQICINVPLLYMHNGDFTGCSVKVEAKSQFEVAPDPRMLVQMTMLSAHCLPPSKDSAPLYINGMTFDGIETIPFGTSLSNADAKKVSWAAMSTIGCAGSTGISVPDDDFFYPLDFPPSNTENCASAYWNTMNRKLVEPNEFIKLLHTPIYIEVAGIPSKSGKWEALCRFIALLDARALLEPGVHGATLSAPLIYFSEADLPENTSPLFEFAPSSAKNSARDSGTVYDEYGHKAYLKIRFDFAEPLIPRISTDAFFEVIGRAPEAGPSQRPLYDLQQVPIPEDPTVDVRRIRKEEGALAVHKELSSFACRGAVVMTQSIKRTAANKLLTRVRAMLRQFPPGECSEVQWQETVTAQHAASRRAVTSSFAPQPPPLRAPSLKAISRCRAVGDNQIASYHLDNYLIVSPKHPRPLLCKALRCLEARFDTEARKYLFDALRAQSRNGFVLWAFGAQEFDKGPDEFDKAVAAFNIAVRADYSDCIGNAIGFAGLHAIHHFRGNAYSSFVAVRDMRKSFQLVKDWKSFLKNWETHSGEEEIFWIPSVISNKSPLLIAAAFFLCLRGYRISDMLIQCYLNGCGSKGSYQNISSELTVDVTYLQASSWLLRGQIDKALSIVENGIRIFGPVPVLCQMRVTCLMCAEGWNEECEKAIDVAEKSNCVFNAAILLQAALGGMETNPKIALQRAARAHKIAPSGHSSLIIARVYLKLDEKSLAERWAAAAVKIEPMLADGWALLALLAMHEQNVDKARALLRTAKQAGNIDADLKADMKQLSSAVPIKQLPDDLVKNLCFCEYF